MNVTRIADKSRPDYWPRRIAELERAVKSLQTARSAQATKISGAGGASIVFGIERVNGENAAVLQLESGIVDNTSPAQLVLYDQAEDVGGPKAQLESWTDTSGNSSGVGVSSIEASIYSGNAAVTVTGGAVLLSGGGTDSVLVDDGHRVLFAGGAQIGEASDGSELRALSVAGSVGSPPVPAYCPVRASSFPTGSSAEIKEDVAPIPFDTLAAIAGAPAQQWRYKPTYATDTATHIGPIAETLPAAMTSAGDDGVMTVDLLSLIGVLWDAVGQLKARVEALEAPTTTAT